MNEAFEVGAVALRAQQRALETHANNVANLNTPGFKRAEVRFSEVISTTSDPISENERIARQSTGRNGGVRMATRLMLSDFGDLQATNSQLDIAIEGAGFIELLGKGGRSVLWRGGRLEVGRDSYLSAQGSLPLRAMILVPEDATELKVDTDGNVSASLEDGEQIDIGQIMLVRPETDSDLSALGAGQYKISDEALMRHGVPGEDGFGLVRQGMMEMSNVEMTQTMVDMLVLQRAYAANAQVIQAADQVASIANNLNR